MPKFEVIITYGCGTRGKQIVEAEDDLAAEGQVMSALREVDYREWERVYEVEVVEIS